MKTGYSKILASITLFFGLAFIASPANAAGSIIATALATSLGWGATATAILAFAINIAVSMIVAKSVTDMNTDLSGASQNPGNRQSAPPATDNKLPVVYGSAWVGGTITDMTISTDNQWIYYVVALSEVTNNGGDAYTFGDVYFGGRKCVFDSTQTYKVTGVLDTSTNVTDDGVNGNLYIYLYRNGTNSPVNSPYPAIDIMRGQGSFAVALTYLWTAEQQMSNCAFAIVQMKYNQQANLTGFQQMKFQINNPRNAPGDCFVDYLTNTVYGAGLNATDNSGNYTQIDTASFNALNTYCNQSFTYTTFSGSTSTQNRFAFNGIIDTTRPIMDNIQEMANSCDCLIKYNEVTGLWGVIVQQPTYTVAMDINDSNMIGAITVSPLDIANSYNVIECKFPDTSNQDSFNTATFDLAQVAPALMYPNEPINKQTVTLSLVNNSVTAQYIATRLLEAGREDLTITCKIDYTGLQLEAGDVVTVTNTNYGWSAKLFRITKVTEQFGSDGTITADLMLTEFNPAVFDDQNITQFTPAENTGLPNALSFGTLAAPLITNQTPTAPAPFFNVTVTAPSTGISQYAEIYYSAASDGSNLIFAGTTEVKPSGNAYAAGETMPAVVITGIASGNWYFYYKIVNGLGTSGLSLPSSILYWRPMTFQYSNRYLMLAYATSSDGTTGFSYSPRNTTYFGVRAVDSTVNSTNPTDYTWFPASPNFGTTVYLLYANWGNRSISFATGTAGYYSGSGNFVSTTDNYLNTIWSGVIDPVLDPATSTYPQTQIDLDSKTGQGIITGLSTGNANAGMLAIQPSADGRLQVALNKFISFGTDGSGAEILQKTVTPALLTVDIYGRVVGFESPDNFYMTIQNYTATSGQTVFTTTRAADYVSGNCLVFQNGILVDTSEYTDSAGSTGTVTFSTGRTLTDRLTIISFRSYHLATVGSFVIGKIYTIVSLGSTTNAQWNTIAGTTGITYAVGSTFTCANIGTGLGTGTASNIYNSFTRFTQSVTNATTTITPTIPITNGFEYLFFNGIAMPDPDYNINNSGEVIDFPATMNGTMTVIQWTANNLTTPNGNCHSVTDYTIAGQSTYSFGLTPYAFNLHTNGVFQINGTTTPSTFTPNDYTTVSGGYTLSTTPINTGNTLLQQSFTRTGAA